MKPFAPCFVALFACALSSRAHAEVYTLGQCLELADKSSLQIEMAKDRVKQAHAQLTEIKVPALGEFFGECFGGLSPQFVGSAVYSPSVDVPFTSNMVPTFKANFDGVIPAYVPNLWLRASGWHARQGHFGDRGCRKERRHRGDRCRKVALARTQ